MDTTPYNPESFYETPHIQALADSGLRLTNGSTMAPTVNTCLPGWPRKRLPLLKSMPASRSWPTFPFIRCTHR